jgi:hypothetical protein
LDRSLHFEQSALDFVCDLTSRGMELLRIVGVIVDIQLKLFGVVLGTVHGLYTICKVYTTIAAAMLARREVLFHTLPKHDFAYFGLSMLIKPLTSNLEHQNAQTNNHPVTGSDVRNCKTTSLVASAPVVASIIWCACRLSTSTYKPIRPIGLLVAIIVAICAVSQTHQELIT